MARFDDPRHETEELRRIGHVARLHVQRGDRPETLADLLDAAHHLRDLTRAAAQLVTACDGSPEVNTACVVAELAALATGDFADRLLAVMTREGMVRE